MTTVHHPLTVDRRASFHRDESLREAIDKAVVVRRRHACRAQIEARIAQLSTREREVLNLIMRGLLNKQMAGELGVHERTIEFHFVVDIAGIAKRALCDLPE